MPCRPIEPVQLQLLIALSIPARHPDWALPSTGSEARTLEHRVAGHDRVGQRNGVAGNR